MIHDAHIEYNNADDHEDRNANLADQGEEDQGEAVNEDDDAPENENEIQTLADEVEVEGLHDALEAQDVPESPEVPKLCSGQITAPVTRF